MNKKKWCEWIEKGAALKLYNKQPSQSSLLGQATTIKRIRRIYGYVTYVCTMLCEYISRNIKFYHYKILLRKDKPNTFYKINTSRSTSVRRKGLCILYICWWVVKYFLCDQ